MATSYADSINGESLTIAINAVAWAQPTAASWLSRCRQLNELLRESTHLLCVPATEKSEPIWYAGVAGTSLAAGIERMAVVHSELRDSIVAFPLDTRIYVANVKKGLVREEWVLYRDAFSQRIQSWRAEGRMFTLLTGGGRVDFELPNAARIAVDIDTKALTFKHASIALIAAGLLRWRDCLSMFCVLAVAIGLSFILVWWQRAPAIEPLHRVAAIVAQPAAPVRYRASAELAHLAMIAARHDAVLWRAHDITSLEYDAAQAVVGLHLAASPPIEASVEQLPKSPDLPPLQPFTIGEFQSQLTKHLQSPSWTVAFGEPYPIGAGRELEQHVTISIDVSATPQDQSAAASLADLSERLIRLPITLHKTRCSIADGVFIGCEVSLTIRGLSA